MKPKKSLKMSYQQIVDSMIELTACRDAIHHTEELMYQNER